MFLLSNFLHLFRARFYHNDPKLRTPDTSGGRRRQGKRKSAAIQSIVDAELVEAHSDAISTSSTVAAISRPSFPDTGWDTSSSALPNNLSLGVIFDHLRACGKHATVKKPFTRGFNFFFWSYIHSVSCCKIAMSTETPTRYFIKAKCWASQSKNESFALECLVEAAATTYLMSIAYAHFSCTA